MATSPTTTAATNQQKPLNRPALLRPAPALPNALENLKAGQARKADPVELDDKVTSSYNRDLQAIISAINEEIKREIVPALHRLKPEYTQDAWPAMMNALLSALATKWGGSLFKQQAERIAAGTVRRIEAENGEAFLKSVNKAVGIEVFGAHSEALTAELEAAAIENADLIKSIADEHVRKVSTVVMTNMRAGYAPSKIAKELQALSGVTRRRAKFIARDQVAKLNGELTKLRNKAAGIEHFRWVTSKDQRVGDDHRRAAERDVGFGPGVYRWDKPPKEGIPGRSARPNCRCTAAPVFPFELPGAN